LENRDITRGAASIGLLTFLSRILGYGRDLLLAALLGTGHGADAFFVAFQLPNLMRRLLGEGALSASFIPVFSQIRERRGEEEARRFATMTVHATAVTLMGITLVGIFAAPLIVRIFVPGFASVQGKLAMTAHLLRIMLPYMIFVGVAAIVASSLQAMHHFTSPALAPIVMNIVFIIYCAIALRIKGDDILTGLGIAVLVGGMGQLFVQLPKAEALGLKIGRFYGLKHEETGRLLKLLAPGALGLAVYQFNILVDRVCASFGDIVGQGAVSALYYSNRLLQLPLAIFGISYATAVFPTLARFGAQEDKENLRATANFALRQVMYLLVPAGVALAVLRFHIIELLFERGEFTGYSTYMTAKALLFYSIGLFAYGCVHILSRAFFALQDTRTPVRIGAFAALINATGDVALMWRFGVGGLALASGWACSCNIHCCCV